MIFSRRLCRRKRSEYADMQGKHGMLFGKIFDRKKVFFLVSTTRLKDFRSLNINNKFLSKGLQCNHGKHQGSHKLHRKMNNSCGKYYLLKL